MKIKNIALDKIKPAAYNPRTIKKEVLDRLVTGISEFGLVDPLIVNADFTLIGGHQRLKALIILGWTEAPCVVLDLDKDKEMALNIALNKIGGEFDNDKLAEMIQELEDDFDYALTGLLDDELDKLLADDDETPPDPPEVKEWELDELYDPFWLVVRGPLAEIHKIKQAVESCGASKITVESSL